MKVTFVLDPSLREPEIRIYTDKISSGLRDLAKRLSGDSTETVNGYTERGVTVLPQSEILRIYSEGQKVFAQTPAGIFSLHARLYEMEELLGAEDFVRISKCELVNKRRIVRLDVSLAGTIGVWLEGDIKTYTSRRYMAVIRKIFGL